MKAADKYSGMSDLRTLFLNCSILKAYNGSSRTKSLPIKQ